MEKGERVSPFKIYISKLLKEIKFKTDMEEEIRELKKARKNISSIITTNYCETAEQIFGFNPVIGNNLLLTLKNRYTKLLRNLINITSENGVVLAWIVKDSKFITRNQLIGKKYLDLS